MLLRVEDIHKRYGKEYVLTGVSFEMKKGEAKVLIGPSGTGKSTLLRCINRLTLADEVRRAFGDYSWPGNVRELKNALERLAVLVLNDCYFLQPRPGLARLAVDVKDSHDRIFPAF